MVTAPASRTLAPWQAHANILQACDTASSQKGREGALSYRSLDQGVRDTLRTQALLTPDFQPPKPSPGCVNAHPKRLQPQEKTQPLWNRLNKSLCK